MVNGHVFTPRIIAAQLCAHCGQLLQGERAEPGDETCQCDSCKICVHRKCIPYVPTCEIEKERR